MLPKKLRAKADKAEVILEEAPEGSDFQYRAYWKNEANPDLDATDLEFFWSDATELVDAMLYAKMMIVEHHHFKFDQSEEGAVTISFGERELGTVEELTDLATATNEAFDLLTDEDRAAAIASDEEEGEEQRGGSVVPDKYKKMYAEQGHAGNCGDWLALLMIELTTGKDGKLDPHAVDEVARLNGIDTSKYNRTTPGWQGRLRMTVRNSLVKKVASAGVINVPAGEHGDVVKAPEAWIAANAPKPKETKGKKPIAA